MTAVSLLSGILTTPDAMFAVSSPTNLEPIIVDSGVSKGQLRHTAGATQTATSEYGRNRGAIEWNSVVYRVHGSMLTMLGIDGVPWTLGDIGDDGRVVTLDYSFDRLIIRSGTSLFYYMPATGLTQVTSPNLGAVVDVMWIDGYTMTTDGTYVPVGELADPTTFKPLKYGSAEEDPDPITGLIKLTGEAYILNRNTIQVFQDQGGSGFPFVNVPGATISVGCVSASAKTLFGKTFAFVGSARGDALGVYVAGSGDANKISTREIDDALAAESDPTGIVLERRVSRDELRLLVHLAGETWCFYAKATEAAGQAVWTRLQSGNGEPYRLRSPVLSGGQFHVGDLTSGAIGVLTDDDPRHFGEDAAWQFDAGLVYNQTKGGILDGVELVGLPGRGTGTVFFSMSHDGETFSQERAITIEDGARGKRWWWRPHVRFRQFMGLRFRGYGSSRVGFAACEVTARGLGV